MKTILAAVAFATIVPLMAQAQTINQAQEGDFYAPSNTVAQQPTSHELNQVKEGDYYAPSKTVAQQSTPQELNQAREGDYYTPGKRD